MMNGQSETNFYGINVVSNDELIYYAKLANCHEFIIAFEDGYTQSLVSGFCQGANVNE